MGDPKKPKNKYSKPTHPWQARRIGEEKELIKKFGLKNKKEVWRHVSFLKSVKGQTKKLIASPLKQAEIEKKQLLEKLGRLNLLGKDAKIEDALDIGVESVLERRLQTLVFKKGFARTPNQARQFIIHRHITLDGMIVTVPSYMVEVSEEGKIGFSGNSKLKDEEHPERIVEKKEKSKAVKVKKGAKQPSLENKGKPLSTQGEEKKEEPKAKVGEKKEEKKEEVKAEEKIEKKEVKK